MSDERPQDALGIGIQALIEARRKADSDDVVEEIRDALWLAQFAEFPQAAALPEPAAGTRPESRPAAGGPPTETGSHTVPPGPTPPVPAAQPEKPEGLFSGQQPNVTGETRAASRVRTPAAAALPNALAIERALRPLRKRRASGRSQVLDEEATVRQLADATSAGIDICVPRFRPGRERWFEVALVVDSGAEMLLWQRTIGDLCRLLARQGAFSNVRAWTLLPPAEGKVHLEDSAGGRHPLAVLHHPEGRRLVLVLTQGTAARWQSPAWQSEIEALARNTPVGIVQFLPESHWPHTALGGARREVSARQPGEPNHRLRLAPHWEDAFDTGAPLVPFPILTLDAAAVATWARMVMARKDGVAPCLLLGRAEPEPAAEPGEWDPALAGQRIEQFRSICSPAAFRLLCHFAAVPLTLPVMRIVREAMVPKALPTDMGAILASGLLHVTGPSRDPEMTFFEFHAGVEALLRETLRRGEERRTYASVKDEIRRYLEAQIGRPLPEDFSYVFDEEGEFELSAAAQSFVDVNSRILERLGLQKLPAAPLTRWPGLALALLQSNDDTAAGKLTKKLERHLQASGYRVTRIVAFNEESLVVDVVTMPSGALISVTAPNTPGRPFSFSNQQAWAASYKELVEFIDSTQDAPARLFGVPELPRPYLPRTVLENSLRFLLGGESPVRIAINKPGYSGKRVLMAAAARHILVRRTYRGGIYWEPRQMPVRVDPGRRLFIQPGPTVLIRHEDAVVRFDDFDQKVSMEVGPLSMEEAGLYFRECSSSANVESLWTVGGGRLDRCAWLGVAIREFPDAEPPGDFSEFFPWLLHQLGTGARERLRQLAVLGGSARIPEPLAESLIPHQEKRSALYRQCQSLCLFQSGEEGWWPLIYQISGELLMNSDVTQLHSRVVDYYSRLAGTAHWDDGYFFPQYSRHCKGAGRHDELALFFNNVDHLLALGRANGWGHLAAELHEYGFHDLAGRLERLAPDQDTTQEELSGALALGRAKDRVYASDALRVYIDHSTLQSQRTSLVGFLLKENYRVVETLVDADVFLSASTNSASIARDAGVIELAYQDESILGDELLGISLSLVQLFQVPELPVPYLMRKDLYRDAREALLSSWRGLVLTGPPGIGKRTLAAALCRMPVLRQHFQGGINWDITEIDPDAGPMLIVLEHAATPEIREMDRVIALRPELGLREFAVPPMDDSAAQMLAGIHNVHGDSHMPIVRFAAGNPGLICQAARIVKHFEWKSVQTDFRLLPVGDRESLLRMAMRKLPERQQKQLADLSVMFPGAPRALADYVAAAPVAEELFALGLVDLERPLLQLSDPVKVPLHRRVCNFYRHHWYEDFPVRVPASETYFWNHIRRHLEEAGFVETLPAVLRYRERWWEEPHLDRVKILLENLSAEQRHLVLLWLADTTPEGTAHYLLQPETEVAERAGLLAKLQALWMPRMLQADAPEVRAAYGRALGVLNLDNRRGVGLTQDGVPDIDWVRIPGGEFIYQEGERRKEETFYAARYPVTNAQYEAFLEDAEGYAADRWWEGMTNPERTPGKGAWGEANGPRETVNWWEAMAYCAWLSEKLGYRVSLPTEWQWERMARGTDGREYPWGNGYISGLANSDETWDFNKVGPHNLGRTSAVGIYPAGRSPEGVMDLSGNVWEWCLNEHKHPKRIQQAGTEPRVLRGGGWGSTAGRARAADRDYDRPGARSGLTGFRPVCSSPIR